jgi:hypothetical protein
MRILGWIREGDLTACGGRVIEGDQRVKGRGRAYAFEGARIACEKGCVIAQGDQGPAPQQFNEQFKLQASGVDGVPYYIVLADGRSQSGRLAADGLMPRIATLQSENYMVYWGDAALVMLAGEGQ